MQHVVNPAASPIHLASAKIPGNIRLQHLQSSNIMSMLLLALLVPGLIALRIEVYREICDEHRRNHFVLAPKSFGLSGHTRCI